MATPLGPGSGSGVVLTCMNTGATAITKGIAVAMEPGDTTKYLPDSITEDVLPVQLFSAANNYFIGIAGQDIAVGKLGTVTVVGVTFAQASGAVTSGNGLEPIDADGQIDDSGGGLAGNGEIGIALEAATTAGQLFRVFVNALGWDGGMGGA